MYSTSKISITSEREVTIDDVVHEGDQMWREVRKSGISFGDADAGKQLLNTMHKSHPQFCKSYPIVCRYMCEMHEYDSRSFRRWLNKIKVKPWKSEDEYLDAQADYVYLLFKAKNPTATQAGLQNVRRNISELLKREHNNFKSQVEALDKQLSAEEARLRAKNATEMREFAKLAGATGISRAEQLWTESELRAQTSRVDELLKDVKYDTLDICAEDLLC